MGNKLFWCAFVMAKLSCIRLTCYEFQSKYTKAMILHKMLGIITLYSIYSIYWCDEHFSKLIFLNVGWKSTLRYYRIAILIAVTKMQWIWVNERLNRKINTFKIYVHSFHDIPFTLFEKPFGLLLKTKSKTFLLQKFL